MDLSEFLDSLHHAQPPQALGLALQALWYDAQGQWERAHALAQQGPGADGAWVHAYLHRKEGDLSNAAYWYSRAGCRPSSQPLAVEWRSIVRALLDEGPDRCG